MKKLYLAMALGLWAAAAFAHSPLQRVVPADGETVAEAPAELIMEFRGTFRLTRVTLSQPEAETGADADPVDLDLDAVSGFSSRFSLPMPSQTMGEGLYLIEWRGLGSDGHVQNGAFSFTVE